MDVAELAPGLWRWTTRHPDWEPGHGWPPEVACFYAETDEATVVVDPLVPRDEPERFWRALDRDVERSGLPVAVLLTCPPHARDAGETAARYGAEVWGHERAAAKVGNVPFHAIRPGDSVAGGIRVLGLDDPMVAGTPLYLPAHRAIAVGDTFLEVEGELRVWWELGDEDDRRLFHERYLPELRRWLDLDVAHVLVAHGAQLAGGRELLAAALEQPPYELM